MNIHAPGFMVAEQYRDRLVAAGVIDAEPEQLTISERSLLDASDGSTVDCSPAVDPRSGGGVARTAPGTPTGEDVARPPASSVAASTSQATDRNAPAAVRSGSGA